MKLVRQRGADDCAVAALATATGCPYEQLVMHFTLSEGGCSWFEFEDVAFKNGFAVQRLFKATSPDWPPEPWCPSHVAVLRLSNGAHCVAVAEDGVILDPNGKLSGNLRDLDSNQLDSVHGLWDVRQPPRLNHGIGSAGGLAIGWYTTEAISRSLAPRLSFPARLSYGHTRWQMLKLMMRRPWAIRVVLASSSP